MHVNALGFRVLCSGTAISEQVGGKHWAPLRE